MQRRRGRKPLRFLLPLGKKKKKKANREQDQNTITLSQKNCLC